MMTTLKTVIDQLQALADAHGLDTPVGTFCNNELRGEITIRYMHRECRKTGLFSGVTITAAKR
jgi:hypothetical protein